MSQNRRKQAVTIWLDPEDVARIDALACAVGEARSTHARDRMSAHLRHLMPEAPPPRAAPPWRSRRFFRHDSQNEELPPEALGKIRAVVPDIVEPPKHAWGKPSVVEIVVPVVRSASPAARAPVVVAVSPIAIEDLHRARRRAPILPGRSLTAALMGDPPPGRSALDQKR